MKVLAVSDRIQEHIYSSTLRTRYSDVEMVFGCGDLPFYYLEYIVTMLTVPVLYVRGNHEARGKFARKLMNYLGNPGGRYYFFA